MIARPSSSVPRRTFLQSAVSAMAAVSLPLAAARSDEQPAHTFGLSKEHEELLVEMETKGRNMLSMPRKDGEFVRLLVKLARAKNVLEIGTSQGYGALWIASGLNETGGNLTTIEILPERVQLARNYLKRAGLDAHINFKEGDAHKIVPTLDGPFDFVLFDADKQGQVDYFNALFPKKLTPGAVLVAHNAIKVKDMMEDYLKLVSNHPDFETVILSLTMDDGFAVSYRRRP